MKNEILEVLRKIAGTSTVSAFENAEEEARYNRSVSGGNQSFSRKAITSFLSDEMVKVESEINGRKVTYGAFAAVADGQPLLISANSVVRRVYSTDGDATGELYQISGITEFGDSPKRIVQTLISQRKGIRCVGTKPLYQPRFVNGAPVYEGMVRRNVPVYDVVDVPTVSSGMTQPTAPAAPNGQNVMGGNGQNVTGMPF